MNIEITTEGTYRNDDWVTIEVEAKHDDETYSITLDSDGTYCVESKLEGDEAPSFVSGLTFEQAWLGIAHAFGVITPMTEYGKQHTDGSRSGGQPPSTVKGVELAVVRGNAEYGANKWGVHDFPRKPALRAATQRAAELLAEREAHEALLASELSLAVELNETKAKLAASDADWAEVDAITALDSIVLHHSRLATIAASHRPEPEVDPIADELRAALLRQALPFHGIAFDTMLAWHKAELAKRGFIVPDGGVK